MKKELSFEERKSIQLEMLKEIDAFCRGENIKYSLAFGTLLGAIRHKGFIPWDDDVDIMMPLPDMLRFKESFYSKNLKYLDVDIDKTFGFGFSRICDLGSYRRRGLFARTYGICIDLYPMVSIPKNISERDLFFTRAKILQKRRLNYMKWDNRIIKILPIRSIPGFHKSIKDYRDYLLNIEDYGKSGIYYIVAGPLGLREKMSYDFDLFNQMTDVDFEGYKFKSIAQYDKYLTLRYGDYMQLPPEDQRHPYHGGIFFRK